MQVKQQQLELNMEKQTGSKLGRCQGCILYPAYLPYMQNTSCEMPGWINHKLESRMAEEISTTSVMQMIPPRWQKGRQISLLMKVKEESEQAGLKLNIQNTKIMASGPITSRQTDEEKMEMAADFIFLDSQITVDADCSHEIKRRLLCGRKAMTNTDSILKSKDITLPTNSIIKAMVFPNSYVQM